MIDGVSIKKITTHKDDRGFFREILKINDDFAAGEVGQLSHSLVNAGVIKAWHGHKVQSQWNYVACGRIQAALYDSRQDSPTHGELMKVMAGDGEAPIAYFFPPGVLHGYRCIEGPMHIIYATSGVYDLSDEVRVPLDSKMIGFQFESPPKGI